MKNGISVIVCCYNSAKRLPETLLHLTAQKTSGFDWEIIIVDNASTDNTKQVADEILLAANPPISYKIVLEPTAGLIHARKCGYKSSEFEYLLFCDDDNWLSDNYLQTAYQLMHNNVNVAILGGYGEAVFEGNAPKWFDTFKENFAVGDQAPYDIETNLVILKKVYGAGFVIRKSLFELLDKIQFQSLLSGRKGNQLISGEDSELCWIAHQLGFEIGYCRNLHFKHLMTSSRMSWSYLKKLYFGFGRMNIYTHAYNHFDHTDALPNFDLKIPFWLDTFIHKFRIFLKMIPKILPVYFTEGDKNVLRFHGLRGELYELLKLNNNYPNVFIKISNYKKIISQISNTT